MENIKEDTKNYIVEELKSEGASALTNSTPLLSSGILDSISALQLVEFLEKKYNIEFQAHEVDQDNLDSLEKIEAFVQSKLAK